MARSRTFRRAVTLSTPKRHLPADRGATALYYLGRIDRDGRQKIHQLVTERASLGELLAFLLREFARLDPIETASMLKLSERRVADLEQSARRRLTTIKLHALRDQSLSRAAAQPRRVRANGRGARA